MIKQIAPKSIQKSPMMCTPTKVTTKILPPDVRVQEGITEVRSMLQRVDNAFKKRKVENEVLALTVSELENQLGYLEEQTQDQMEATTSLNLALAFSRKGIDNIQVEVGKLDQENIEPVNILIDELTSSLRDACQVTGNCTAEQSRAVLAASCVNTSATAIANECEAYIQDSNEIALACEAVRAEADSKQTELEVVENELTEATEQMDVLSKSLTQAETALPLMEERLSELCTAQAHEESRATSLAQRTEELQVAEEKLKEATSLRRTAFETQLALREEELAGLAARHAELSAHRDVRYQALQYMHKQRGEQDSSVTKCSLCVQAKQVQLEASEEELRAVIESVGELEEQLQVAHTDLAAAQLSAQETAQDNEEQYELTCMRMTQLREVHQQQSALALSLNQEKVRLAAKTNVLTSQVRKAQNQRTELEAQVKAQRQQAKELAHRVQHSHTELIEQQRLQEEETNTLKQLTAEADVMQANMEQYERDNMRRVELEAAITAAEQEAEELQLHYTQQQADKQAAVAELSSLKAQVAEAKEKRKKGLSADSLEELTAEQQEQLDAEVETELQEVTKELDTQHIAEVQDINNCRDKLAQGFPGAVENCEEVKEKEKALAVAREALVSAESAIAQLLELQHEQECRNTAAALTAAANATLEDVMSTTTTGTGDAGRERAAVSTAGIPTSTAETHDEFPLFERQEADVHFDRPEDALLPASTEKVQQRAQRLQSKDTEVEHSSKFAHSVSSQQKTTVHQHALPRQRTPPRGSALSRWEMSEPAKLLVHVFPKSSQAALSQHAFVPEGVTQLHAASGDFLDDMGARGSPPPAIRRFGHVNIPKNKVDSQEHPKRQKKEHGKDKGHRERSGVSSETSSFDILKPQPSLAHPSRPAALTTSQADKGGEVTISARLASADNRPTTAITERAEQQQRRAPGMFSGMEPAPKPLSASSTKPKPVHSHQHPVKHQPKSCTTAHKQNQQHKAAAPATGKPTLRFPDMKPPEQHQQQRARHLNGGNKSAKVKLSSTSSDWFGEDAPF